MSEHFPEKPRRPSSERRQSPDRRSGEERREEIRYEPHRQNRRSGNDRRKHDGWDGTLIR